MDETKQENEVEAVRDDKGRFVKGSTGNPRGRPAGTKNKIAEMKRNLELAVREGISEAQITAILQSMIAEAMNGNVTAGKLILDKVMSNARLDDDEGEDKPEIVIKIQNLTPQHLKDVQGETIDQEEN